MRDEDIAFAGVAGQAELLRRGELSARALTEVVLARIERLDPELNAFGAVYRERALSEAAAADERRAAGESGPLLGIPIAVKDEMDLRGQVTSRGTGAYVTPAAADAEVVARLRAAGAVIVGKTTMPELGLWPFTESISWGVTRNPWDPERTPGGSSGGSAAAVAAGMVPAALAADGAGSIRIPAACTGLFGLKPQAGRVSRAPADETSHWVVYGALTRSVRDTAIVLDMMGDAMPGDRERQRAGDGSAGTPSFTEAAGAAPRPLRIGTSEAFPAGVLGRLSPDVAGALGGTAALLRSLGHTVEPVDIPFGLRDSVAVLALLFRGIRDLVGTVERPQRLERRTRALARPGVLIPDAALRRLLEAERRLRERMDRLFADYDALLTPVLSDTPVRAGLMEGRGAVATYAWSAGWVPFNVLWNSTGQPAMSVPAGESEEGLPLAVQVVGRPHDEATLLSLAGQLEGARPWTQRRPPIG